MNKHPNIVYLMTDQQKASAASFLGNRCVVSPFMDRMAENGTVFSRAYAASSICTPSRASVHTGVYPLVHQATCHQNRAPYNLPQMAELLSQAGYYTAAVGHYEDNRNLGRGYHERTCFLERGPLYNSVLKWGQKASREVSWSAGGIDCTEREGNAWLLTDRAIRMLDAAKATGMPFFLHVSYLEPHPCYFVPPPYDTLINPATIPLPPKGNDDRRPPWQFKCMTENGSERATEADIRKIIAVYYGMIAYADAQMQRLYQAMAERDLLENTWFIISSDHGDYTGEKGLFCKTESLYECLLHVPLIITPPLGMHAPRKQRMDELVNLVDLFPTILKIAGLPAPEYAQGFDLLAWMGAGARKTLRDCLFAQVGNYHGFLKTTWPHGIPLSGRHPSLLQGIRTKDYSYTRDADYGDEAYDLRKDPFELENLLNDQASMPEAIKVMNERMALFEEECINLRKTLKIVPGDRGFVQGWE